jgi:glycosyltransferase involved in cell wall biosynthesis
MRILFIAPYIPSLIHFRSFNFTRVLAARGHKITLLALQPPGESMDALPQLRQWCETVKVVPHNRIQTLWNGLTALPSDFPLQAAYSNSWLFDRTVQELLSRERYDVAHIEHLRGAVLAKCVGTIPVVFDTVDSITLLFEKVLENPPGWKSRLMAKLDLDRTRRFESCLTQRFSQVIVTSELDRQTLIRLGNDYERMTVVPIGVDLEYFQPQPKARNPLCLIFTGKMSYHANIAAAVDLVEKIMPLVWAREPRARLLIVGKDPTRVVQALGTRYANVTVTGSVPDVRPYLAEAAIAVSAMRYSVGMQTKVLEAMAMGTPVVCSTQASSSLRVQHGQDVFIGDTAESIAQHILELLGSPDKRKAIGDAGRRYVETHQSWESSVSLLEGVYAKTLHGRYEAVTARG